ncbi:MAG: DUF1727 domain-containing protein, partial [Chloroflexi bacterium]|nr:DUF1727 domain-containing protein [Chloroflexota bacterium]
MDPRLLTAVSTGKLAGFLSRRLHLGGGTTFPGTVARRIDGQLLTKLSARLGRGSLVVTGTNGKTTTTRLVANIVTAAGWSPVHNRAGANLLNGLATALVAHAAPTRTGRSPAPDGAGAVGLFEVDEAVFPAAVLSLQPRAVVLTNLFRDQLDRYGEIDHLAHLWRGALARCGPATTAILNADDPVVAAIGRGLAGPVIYYGIEDARHSLDAPEHAADSKVCPECGAPYDYRAVYYGHLGLYRCPRGHVERPAAHVAAETVALRGADGAELTIRLPAGPAGDAPDGAADGASSQTLSLAVPLSGLYTVYNVLAAITAARALGADVPAIGRGVEGFAAAFGRLE